MTRRPARQPVGAAACAGFTLIEALIGVAVLAVAALALGALQTSLARHADLARQRTEAAHLAASKIEELRGFEQLAAAPGRGSYAALADGDDVPAIAGNARFARHWQVGGTPDDPFRAVQVRVDWLDRATEPASTTVSLLAMIARNDPAAAGALEVSPSDAAEPWRPRRRVLDVPIEATRLDGANRGRSTRPWDGPGGGHMVFDDATGRVVARCPDAPGDTTDIATHCLPLAAVLLRGDLSGAWATELTAVALDGASPAGGPPSECVVADARDQNDGHVLAGTRSFRCLVIPRQAAASPDTPLRWTPAPTGTRQVCRYLGVPEPATGVGPGTPTASAGTADPAAGAATLNPATSAAVASPPHHRNFLFIEAGACPPGTVVASP